MIDKPTYDLAYRPPPAIEEIVRAWRYRGLVQQLVRRDIVARYKRSVGQAKVFGIMGRNHIKYERNPSRGSR